MSKSVVAVLRTSPETVLEDYAKLMDMAGVKQCLAPGARTILKTNISWHIMFPGANTTPWQLEGTVAGLRTRGYEDLVAVENETVVTNPFKGERLNKFTPVFEAYDIPVLYNFKPQDMKWIRYQPKGKFRVLGDIFEEGVQIPEFFVGKNIVHLPTVKCHIYTGTTGAMKNAFGGLLTRKRHWTHDSIHETLVDLLMIQKEIHPGLFTLMDGTTAGNGAGPRTMVPAEKNLILASGDSVAIDAVAAKMMGFDPMKLDFIRLAHEAGLGVGNVSEIEMVGEDVSKESWGFSVGENMVSRFGKKVWFGPFHFLQNLLFRTPLVYFFIFGSALYHDHIWYPVLGDKVVRDWKKSVWGRLFDSYEVGLRSRKEKRS